MAAVAVSGLMNIRLFVVHDQLLQIWSHKIAQWIKLMIINFTQVQ